MSASKDSIIKSLYIEDFQSHKETKITLPGPGQLCVITGHTDSGKTAIVRALRLLMYNQPQGSDYIRVGRDRATVAVEMQGGTKVARERSRGSVNRYRVTKPGESLTVLEGFGVSVPVEVQEVTGVRVVSIGETLDLALNLSEQLDGPFLGKSVSGPAKAKILGALAGTEEVDEAQRSLGTDLHRATQEEKRLADEVERLAGKIAEYDYLPGLAERIGALETLLETAKKAQTKLCALKAIHTQLAGINDRRIGALDTLARWVGLLAAAVCAESAQGSLAKMQTLGSHKTSLARIDEERRTWRRIHIRWAGLDAATETHRVLEAISAGRRVLAGLQETLAATTTGIAKYQAALGRWNGLDDAQNAHIEAADGVTKLRELMQLRAKYDEVLDAELVAGKQYGRWYRLDDAVKIESSIPASANRLSALVEASNAIVGNRQARVVAENALSRHSGALCDAQSLYADTLISLGRCPLCGSTVSPESLSQHIEEVA